MSILDNATAPPAAASEPPAAASEAPAAPLDRIELPAEGAAQHPPPTVPLKLQRRQELRRFPPRRLMMKRRRQQRFPNPPRVLRKSSEDGRLSPGKAGIQTAAPRGREITLRASSRR
jgi:hypothetical protein